MDNQLFIPKKINVGFQEREGTYSGLLAYIIYWDNKGVLRKETSWESWRHKPEDPINRKWVNGKYVDSDEKRGDKVKAQALDNVPINGFVLNKGVGGQRQSWGWNARNEYIRVYDPRGFEFEISVANLLFILQETNSIVGKGLEGEFVYSWDGKELVLLPTCSLEYKESSNFTDLQDKKVGAGDMVPGCCYTSKAQQRLIYLGRFLFTEFNWSSSETKKTHVFLNQDYNEDEAKKDRYYGQSKYITFNGFTKLGTKDTETPVENYAELMDDFSKSKHGCLIKNFIITNKPLRFKNFKADESIYNREHGTYFIKDGDRYVEVTIVEAWNKNRRYLYSYQNDSNNEFNGYQLNGGSGYSLVDGKLIHHYYSYSHDTYGANCSKFFTKEQLEALTFVDLELSLESGEVYKINQYFKQ